MWSEMGFAGEKQTREHRKFLIISMVKMKKTREVKYFGQVIVYDEFRF